MTSEAGPPVSPMDEGPTGPDEVAPLVLRAGSTSATIHPGVGGRLGQLDLGTGPLLRGPAPELGWAHWGCYPLLPWSNRIPRGHLRSGTIDVSLPVNWPDGSAIHGLAAARAWTILDTSDRTAELEVRVSAGPYQVRGTQTFELDPQGLRLRLAAMNEGDRPVPLGIGIHPWFCHGPVRVPASQAWPGEPIPSGPPRPVGAEEDLRARTVPAPMDRCYTALTDTSADVPGVRLSWDGPVTQVVVYTREPGWTCVEPVTMANDGFDLAHRGVPDHGVQIVAPGEALAVTYQFTSRPSEHPDGPAREPEGAR